MTTNTESAPPRFTIAIAVYDDGERFGIDVWVTGSATMLEVAGAMEIAKKQHIDSKHTTGPTVYQAPDEPVLAQCEGCGSYRIDGKPPILHRDGCPAVAGLVYCHQHGRYCGAPDEGAIAEMMAKPPIYITPRPIRDNPQA